MLGAELILDFYQERQVNEVNITLCITVDDM